MTVSEQTRRPSKLQTTAVRSILALVGAAGLTAMVGGCDTTAKIGFSDRNLREIHSAGFVAPANPNFDPGNQSLGQACQTISPGGNATAKMRFVMVGSDSTPILPGQSLKGGVVEEGTVGMSTPSGNDGYLFDHPDLACTQSGAGSLSGPGPQFPQQGDAGMPGGDAGSMASGSDGPVTCDQPQSCRKTIDANAEPGAPSLARCSLSTSYSIEGVRHISNGESGGSNLYGVLMEDSASTYGWYPNELDLTYYDRDGDGRAEEKLNSGPGSKAFLASDPNLQRSSALELMKTPFQQSKIAAEEARAARTYFGLWETNGQPMPENLVSEATGSDGSTWTQNPADVARATGLYTDGGTQDGDRGNIVEAMDNVLETAYVGNNFEGADKTLAVFVDGPPEQHPDRRSASVESIIEKATNNDVRIFIVHLDAQVDTSKLADDFRYWGAQQNSCSSDSDCQSFETCRQINGIHRQTPDGDVTGVQGEYSDKTWCMPERRESDGRFGPLQMYNRMACATQGGYIYIKEPEDLEWALPWLPYTIEGLWEADISITEAQRPNSYTAGEPIRLQTSLSVSVAESSQTIEFSQRGQTHRPEGPESGDNRGVIFTTE